jgi:hypothetical protein
MRQRPGNLTVTRRCLQCNDAQPGNVIAPIIQAAVQAPLPAGCALASTAFGDAAAAAWHLAPQRLGWASWSFLKQRSRRCRQAGTTYNIREHIVFTPPLCTIQLTTCCRRAAASSAMEKCGCSPSAATVYVLVVVLRNRYNAYGCQSSAQAVGLTVLAHSLARLPAMCAGSWIAPPSLSLRRRAPRSSLVTDTRLPPLCSRLYSLPAASAHRCLLCRGSWRRRCTRVRTRVRLR